MPRRELPIEDSWRIVEGENDSFDTSILPPSEDVLFPLSSENPSSGFPSQVASSSPSQSQSQSQPQSSQDSIRDFNTHQSDEQVILRSPFRPSVASLPRSPEPQFKMPILDMESSSRRSSGRSSVTARPDDYIRRRNINKSTSSPTKRRIHRYASEPHIDEPSVASHALSWGLSVIGLAFRYAKRPLAVLLAIYLSCGAIIMTQNMLFRSISASLSPLCRIPGVMLLNLPFCDFDPRPVEFDDIVGVQSKFEDVLATSYAGVSLPFEMIRSQASLRDLRSLIEISNIQSRDELLFELNGYIETAGETVDDLTGFNVHIGSAVDFVVIINRWTSRYISSLDASSSRSSPLSTVSNWLFHPFQLTDSAFNNIMLREKYKEHASLVSERISSLIDEAQVILRKLARAEGYLSAMNIISTRTSADINPGGDHVFYNIWTFLGGRSRNVAQQLALLKEVDTQRSSAIYQLSALVIELKAIQATLGDLRDSVDKPLVDRKSAKQSSALPFRIHVETIEQGIERLAAARKRISAAEDDEVEKVVARGGLRSNERLIDGKKK